MKRSLVALACVLIVICVGAWRAMPLQNTTSTRSDVYAQNDSPMWCVSVWYPSSDMPGGLDTITGNADLISTVNPFWYAPQPDGTLYTTEPDAENAALLARWRGAA